MGVFGDYALKYYENGIYVIPTDKDKKVLLPTGYQNNASKLEYVEKWIEKSPNAGIGALMGVGKLKDVVAFDIDIESEPWTGNSAEDNMKLAAHCLPYSPVFKKGKKGVTIFYRAYFEFSKPHDEEKLFDYISVGKYTILPPSDYYNKETLELEPENQYKWGPVSLLEFDVEDLPELKQQHIDHFFRVFGKKKTADSKITSGRDNHITDMVWAAVCKNKPREMIIEEVLEIDRRMHNPPFVTDTKEAKVKNRKPWEVIANFVDLAIKNRGEKYQPGLEIPTDKVMYSFDKKEIVMPQLPQFLKEMAIFMGHGTKCYNGSVIFSLFFFSQIFGKRIEFYNSDDDLRTALNLYFLYVCPSGIGKGRVKHRLLKLLRAFKGKLENARRVSAPKSEAAIYKMFKKPVVAIIQEEFHKILVASKNPNNHLSGVNETLADVFGESVGELLEKDAADETNSAGYVLEPYLSILGMTQTRNFRNKIMGEKDPDEIFHQGLGARLIYAYDKNKLLPKIQKGSLTINYFEKEINERLKYVEKDQLNQTVPQIPLGKGVLDLVQAFIEEYDQEYDAEEERSDEESLLLPVINRRMECAIKIATIYALCEIPTRGKLIFECSDLLGAIELIKYFETHLDFLVYNENMSDDLKRVFDRIESAKDNGITEREIYRKNHQKADVVNKQILELLSKGLIAAAERKNKTGPASIVYISSKFFKK